jgi:pimeloyl-ACP methyl ester carboxylesterase
MSGTRYLSRKKVVLRILSAAVVAMASPSVEAASTKPTIVLVHGAMADSSSWGGVIPLLVRDGYQVVAVAEPLRSLSGDSEYLGSILRSIPGKVILVGHSYGGSVITEVADPEDNIKALVYVAAFAPDKGESALQLIGRYKGSELGAALAQPILLGDGSHDLMVDPTKYKAPFAADLPEDRANLMAVTQRPVNEKALNEPATNVSWRNNPAYFVYGDKDKSIPPVLQAAMAERAHSRGTVVVPGASHLVMLSHPESVVGVIEDAADSP